MDLSSTNEQTENLRLLKKLIKSPDWVLSCPANVSQSLLLIVFSPSLSADIRQPRYHRSLRNLTIRNVSAQRRTDQAIYIPRSAPLTWSWQSSLQTLGQTKLFLRCQVNFRAHFNVKVLTWYCNSQYWWLINWACLFLSLTESKWIQDDHSL